MSRSYRKNVIATDGQSNSKSRKWRRTKSNQELRRKLKNPDYDIADGKSYKNGHSWESWDICDWKIRMEKPLNDRIICGVKYITTKKELEKHYNGIKRK